jgi:hypothetical protein
MAIESIKAVTSMLRLTAQTTSTGGSYAISIISPRPGQDYRRIAARRHACV